jgi:hypothetical protein
MLHAYVSPAGSHATGCKQQVAIVSGWANMHVQQGMRPEQKKLLTNPEVVKGSGHASQPHSSRSRSRSRSRRSSSRAQGGSANVK